MNSHTAVRKDPKQIQLQYKRDYMRQWRARPENAQRELQTRQRAYAHQKLDRAAPGLRRVCGFCRQRAPVETVIRLVPVPTGFVERRVPYCGEC